MVAIWPCMQCALFSSLAWGAAAHIHAMHISMHVNVDQPGGNPGATVSFAHGCVCLGLECCLAFQALPGCGAQHQPQRCRPEGGAPAAIVY